MSVNWHEDNRKPQEAADTQTIAALEPVLANGLHSPHLTKKIKRKLRALEKFVYRYSQQRKEK